MVNTRFVLIPFWIHESLKRQKLPISTLLDFKKLSKLFSINDLVTFSTFQSFVTELFGVPESNGGLGLVWSVEPEDLEAHDLLYRTVYGLTNDASFKGQLHQRLFDINLKSSEYEKPFDLFDLGIDKDISYVGVVVYPGHFTFPAERRLQLSLVEGVLKLFYVYNPYHEVAGTMLFKRYLQLLDQ